jgi:hypothetical protein
MEGDPDPDSDPDLTKNDGSGSRWPNTVRNNGREKSARKQESSNDLESINRRTECAADEAERLVRLLLEVLGEVGGLLDPPEHLHRPVTQKVNLKVKFFQNFAQKSLQRISYNLLGVFDTMVLAFRHLLWFFGKKLDTHKRSRFNL